MNISWKIIKKRGNYRPTLHYTITLTEHERELAVSSVRVESTIPKPPDTGWMHCWPEQNERSDWEPKEYYSLMTPSHKVGQYDERIKLPWRENNTYPEIESSFLKLRIAFEEALLLASESSPISEQGMLETSTSTKRNIAFAVAASRVLQAVRR
ncbi:hypothetical protein [Desulfovibrio inopinatus]|uniref:hypothetical protein n=1 Tax=Desulfovibrio inopinatus TaxID=102109 RepID=UPI00041B36CC|nr:hypothetical protein [Desulfovibrio inopinatus]